MPQTAMGDWLHDVITLVAVSATTAVVFDTHSFRVISRTPISGTGGDLHLPYCASFSFAPGPEPNSLICAACAAFDCSIALLSLKLRPRDPIPASSVQPTPNPVSILSAVATDPTSPLLGTITLPSRPKADPVAAMKARVSSVTTKKVVDKPVTFRTKIKSSGYLRPLRD